MAGGRLPRNHGTEPGVSRCQLPRTFGEAAFSVVARTRGLRDLGDRQAPFDAWVNYPGLESRETHENARKYLEGGYGGMSTSGLEGVDGSDTDPSARETTSRAGYDAAETVCNEVDLASLLADVGDAKTLIIHPASTTHQQLTEEEELASGVTDDLVRLSVGIEDVDDVIADLDRVIDAV